MPQKPFAESCAQNREPVLTVIKPVLKNAASLLEIGSGTGQHAVYFASELAPMTWQTSDCRSYLNGIKHWIDEAGEENLLSPIELDVTSEWPNKTYDAIFTANTVHIMGEEAVTALFQGAGRCLDRDGVLLIYGPFNYKGNYTSDSNRRFDQWLKERDPASGIKHFEDICRLADNNGMKLENDFEMPANNRILSFRKR